MRLATRLNQCSYFVVVKVDWGALMSCNDTNLLNIKTLTMTMCLSNCLAFQEIKKFFDNLLI